MVRYSIRVAPTMFVQYCSDGLFETTTADLRIFTKKECSTIMERLKDRYIYDAVLTGTDGSTEKINSLKPHTEVKKTLPSFEVDDCFSL